MRPAFVTVEWSVPDRFNALVTTRSGGVSRGRFGDLSTENGFNLGDHVGDDPAAVASNRQALADCLPSPPVWLEQVHRTDVHHAKSDSPPRSPPRADAAVTCDPGVVLAVLTADCLPVVFADPRSNVIGIAHAGWRGLAAGVLENTLAAMVGLGADTDDIVAWLGPAIGASAFEVGDDVREVFCAADAEARNHFVRSLVRQGKWYADLHGLAALRLAACGVVVPRIPVSCTYTEAARFYSYRRDGVTGRMATLAWMSNPRLRPALD